MTATRVKAVRDLGLNKGATAPHLMECSDGKTYLVKFADETKAVVNEYLGSELSHKLGLPVPPNALVKVPPEVISSSTDLLNREIMVGFHHGSELVTDAQDLEELERKQAGTEFKVVNFGEIPGIICLDNWIMTMDRHRKGNHLLQPVQNGFRYYTVDFSHSFTGPNWTAESLARAALVRDAAPTSTLIQSTITGPASVESSLSNIESTGDSDLETLVAGVPDHWGLNEEERRSLVSFLQARRQIVREITTTHLTAASSGV